MTTSFNEEHGTLPAARALQCNAIAVHNKAVALLQNGNYREAATAFANALGLSKQAMLMLSRVQNAQEKESSCPANHRHSINEAESPRDTTRTSTSGTKNNKKSGLSPSWRCSLDECMSRGPLLDVSSSSVGDVPMLSRLDHDHEDTTTIMSSWSASCTTTRSNTRPRSASHYMYRRAILVLPSKNEQEDMLMGGVDDGDAFDYLSIENVNISIIVLFNLALTHHFLALCGEDEDTAGAGTTNLRCLRLKKAAKLYELALGLHAKQQEANLKSPIYTMACVNNLGLIYLDLLDDTRADRCFQHLLQALMFLVDRRQQTADSIMFDGLFGNATGRICQQTTTCCSAAA